MRFYDNSYMKIIYEDDDLLVADKPAGIVVFPEGKSNEETLIDYLLKEFSYLKNVGQEPRYGIVHRLDKDTSGVILIAKNDESLRYLQKQFKEGKVSKKYIALVVGEIKENQGKIESLIGRDSKDRKKQKTYLYLEPEAQKKGLRTAVTRYNVLKRFKGYTLLEVFPETGRKHQIRVHLLYLGYPIAGDKIYSFKGKLIPKGLKRQFLHANCIKIKMVNGKTKEFCSELPEDLEQALKIIN
ncbi:MAG TPA: RluA family pseudouridine synthase [bacterium]|nr:RluA family pseudouridine synthase [bacterium]